MGALAPITVVPPQRRGGTHLTLTPPAPLAPPNPPPQRPECASEPECAFGLIPRTGAPGTARRNGAARP